MRRMMAASLVILALVALAGCQSGPPTSEEQVKGYLKQASFKKRAGNLEGSLNELDLALSIMPDSGSALVRRGTIYAELGDTERAMADFARALELNPDNVVAYVGRGVVRRDNDDLNGSLADLNRAIELVPNLAEAYFERGRTLALMGRTDQAIENLSKSITLNPEFVRSFLWRAYCHMAAKDNERAARDLRHVREYATEPDLVRRANELLSKIYLNEP